MRCITISDGNVLKGLSALNWVRTADAICTCTGGAWLRVRFEDARSVELLVDPACLESIVPTRYPVVAWTVDGGALQSRQLRPGETSIRLTGEVTSPKIDLYAKGFSPFENRYSGSVPENSLVITGFRVDAGELTTPSPISSPWWLNIGDSIMSGDAALLAEGQGRPPDDAWAVSNDARASYGHLLARHYEYSESRLAYGGYGWNGGLAGLPAVPVLIDQITSVVNRLDGDTLEVCPDVVLVNLGENGVPAETDVHSALTKLRRRIGNAGKIIVMVPVSGVARREITAAYYSYKTAARDKQVFLVDIGKISFDTADGQHPTAAGHEAIFRAALPAIDAILLGR